ncbi:uncharacterized protein LOC143850343 [Tasmannia lanceolata]|uniref:uncharacterized protein LOC143850343 n=1 Tax=Tasmannia lanceolata TaxID=3420 RepID=UPI0040629214
MAEPNDALAKIQEMMVNLTRDMTFMKEEMAQMKAQSNEKVSTSRAPAVQPPPGIPANPSPANLNHPFISPVDVDLEEGQYAAEYCIPNVAQYNKEKQVADQLEKLTKEMESLKHQGPKQFDISELIMSPGVTLPPKFKTPDYDKYDGTGCPRNHMRWFIEMSQQCGLSPEQMARVFPMSLTGVAKKWFLRRKPEEVQTLQSISNKFVEQFSMEEGIEVTKRDLKQLKQGPLETFTFFIRRWRRKSAQLSERLSEEDQIKLVIKGLSPQYFHFMSPQHYTDFDHLIKTGTRTEDAIAKGLRARLPSDIKEGKRPVVVQKEVDHVNHVRPAARTVTEVARPAPAPVEQKPQRHFDPLPYPLPLILKKLIRDKKIRLPDIRPVPNPLPPYWRADQYCEYHRNSGHLTERCLALKHALQTMLENGKLEVERPNVTRNPLPNHRAIPPPVANAIFVEEPVLDPSILICAITPDEPYILRFDPEEIEEMERERSYALWRGSTSLAETSSPCVLRCEDVEAEKETPYVLRMSDFEEEEAIVAPYVLRMDANDLLLLEDQCDELRHVTRGGRVFKPAELRAENPAEAVRAAENQGQNRPSADEEEDNLLKQLKKTQANVSIWGLLMSSSKHRKVVLKELNAAQVPTEITPDELVSLVAVTRASKVISFTDDDLPPEGSDHARSLKITVICNKKRVPEVLVDNGSALNICPLSTAATLGFGPGDFIPSEQGILAYDGTRRDVIGTLATEIQIGGEDFDIEFQVLDIKASFLLLLGRPWLHKVGVIPSTLHQKSKFVHNGRVVTVKGDPDLEIGQISQELVVGKEADVSLTGFSLEVSVISMKEAMGEEVFFLTSTNSNVVRMIRKQGYIPGAGLGKYHQGPTEWPVLRTFNGLFGLGYEPTKQEVKEMKRYMLKWAECRRRGLELPMGPISLIRNGIFRKEGADFPFCGFAEPWTDDVTGQRFPGFEIFFNLELSEAPMSAQITEATPKTDWADVLEPGCLNGMFQIEYPVAAVVSSETEASEVAVIGRDAFILNPAELITPAEGPLTNWTSQVLPRVVFQYSPVSSKESVVSKYTSTSQSDIEFVYSNDSFDAGTVEVGSGSGVGDKSLSNKVESKSTLDDEFISSTAHMPELAEFNVELSVESVNTSLESNTMPAVGYSILDVTNTMNEMKDSFTYIPVSVSPVSISKWLANIVPVPKKDGKVRMCVDFRDLNKIKMAPEDMIKTAFTTQWGTYCYRQDSGSKKERPVYYISKKMLEYEVKYTILEKTCLALVWATQRLRHYLLSSKVLLLSRMDPLKYLFEKPALTGRTARWLLLLSEFDITYVTQKSVKGRVIAEHLADSPVEESAFLKAEFPDEEIMDIEEDTPNTRWTMYFDGAVNNQGQGIGAVLVSPQKEYIPISIKLQTKNHFADALATLASMLDISATMEVQPLTVRLQWEPAHVTVIEIAARCPDGKPWYTDIRNLISGEGHPPGASGKERKTLQKLAANFVICGGQLYRRSFDGIQLLCVDEDKAVELIEQTHEGAEFWFICLKGANAREISSSAFELYLW